MIESIYSITKSTDYLLDRCDILWIVWSWNIMIYWTVKQSYMVKYYLDDVSILLENIKCTVKM